jgi:autotransporter-associated beta strand protein
LSGTLQNNGFNLSVTAGEVDLGKITSGNYAAWGIAGISSGATVKITGSVDQLYFGTAGGTGVNGLEGTLNLNGNSQSIPRLAGTAGIVECGGGTVTLTVAQTTTSSTFNGTIKNATGTLSLTKTGTSGTSTLTLGGANTYSGATTISSGTLALGASGSISNSTSISISPSGTNATFDVSAIANYVLSSSTTLIAGVTNATWPATIKGGTTVSLGSQGVTLNYDGVDVPLTVSQGTLALNNNVFTIVTSSALNPGVYTLVSTPGAITGTVNATPSYTGGSGVASGCTGVVSISGNNVILTVSASIAASAGANGSISPSGTTTVIYNGNQTYSITPNPGYSVSGVTVDGSSVGAVTSYTFNNVTTTHTISATFAINSYTLTYNGGVNGTISGTTPQTVTYLTSGSSVTAVANAGYTFSRWSDGVLTAARTDTALIGGTNVTAQYTTNTYTLTYNGSSGGYVSGSTNQLVTYLTSGTQVTATASNGYAFLIWSDGVTTSNRTDTALIGGTNVTASFMTTCSSPTIVGGISPGSVTATVGDQVVLTVTNVAGTAPLSYQWLSNTVAIANATNSSYTNLSVLVSDAGNYQVVITNGCGSITSSVVVSVSPQTPLIATLPTAATINYGQALSAATLTGGSVTNAAGATITGSFAYNAPATVPGAGTASQAVTFTPDDTTNYNNISTSVSVPVSQVSLTITAQPQTITYGASVPGTTVTYSGFVNGDTNTSLTTQPTVASAQSGVVAAGTYTGNYTASGAVSANYNISYVSGTLTVSPASTTVQLVSSAPTNGYLGSVFFTATNLPTTATSNVVFSANGTAFSTNGVASGGASSSALSTLPRGTNLITAIYLGDSNYVGSTNSLNQIVTNHPPVASAASYTRNAAVSTFKVLVSDLLTNASDVDGDTLTLVSVGTPTNATATVLISGGWVLYSNANAVADQFSYTVSDGYGGTNSATVTITVDSTPLFGQSALTSTTGGTATLNFAGIPGYSYSVNRSTNLTDWVTLWTTNAPASGVFEYLDNPAPTPSAYYRLQYNP